MSALAARAPHEACAEKVFLLAAEGKIPARITASSLTDIHYLLWKHLRDAEASKYEGALLAACAKRNRIDLIVTRDEPYSAQSPAKASGPEEFLAGLGE